MFLSGLLKISLIYITVEYSCFLPKRHYLYKVLYSPSKSCFIGSWPEGWKKWKWTSKQFSYFHKYFTVSIIKNYNSDKSGKWTYNILITLNSATSDSREQIILPITWSPILASIVYMYGEFSIIFMRSAEPYCI